jgi:CRISPR/Cas system-associated exonuclease Cas4 (RecB family)
MNTPKHPTLIHRMSQSRIRQLQARGPVLAASLVVIAKHCGRPGCHCQRGEKHRGHYLTYKEQGKTRTVYVPLELVEEVKRWIKEHRRIKTLIQELSVLSLAQVRTHVRARRSRAGRS